MEGSMLEFFLPILLLILAFLFKFLIDQSASLPLFIKATLEFPVDIAFLALSFIVAYSIASQEDSNIGLLMFIVYLICIFLIVFSWRRAEKFFREDNQRWAWGLFTLNMLVSILGLVISINKLVGILT